MVAKEGQREDRKPSSVKWEETTKHDSKRWVHLKDTDGKLLPWVMTFPSGQNEAWAQTEKIKAVGSDLGLIFKFMGLVGDYLPSWEEKHRNTEFFSPNSQVHLQSWCVKYYKYSNWQ